MSEHHHDHQHRDQQRHQHGPSGGDDPDISELHTPEYWDARYRTAPALWSGNANVQLVANASGLTPGTALDVGSGEGGDAIWLASRGWRVTGVDVSQVALDRAADHAAHVGADISARICWQQVDILTWAPPLAAYDLVTSHFLHLPSPSRSVVQGRLAAELDSVQWEVVVAATPERETVDPDGRTVTIKDAVLLARSRG